MKDKKTNNPTRMSKQTRRSSLPQAYIKQEEITLESGQTMNVAHITQKGKDINFERIFLAHVIEAISAIGNKKIELLMWLFSVKNAENQIVMTQRAMAEASGISLPTVSATLKELAKHDFIKKASSSVYQINPDAIFKGSADKRMDILLSYQEIGTEKDHQEIKEETKISDDPEQSVITYENGEDDRFYTAEEMAEIGSRSGERNEQD